MSRALGTVGVQALVLRSGGSTGGGYRPIQLLITAPDLERAQAALESLPWRYSWVRDGLLRLVPGLTFWEGDQFLEVYWSIPASPLPAVALGRLTRELWRTARSASDGHLRPDPAALLVHLAVQSCRPGRRHDGDWADFVAHLATMEELGAARELAQRAGVSAALGAAMVAAANGASSRPRPELLFDRAWGLPWRMMISIQRRARPARLQRLLVGSPAYGDATIRCRVGGIEVLCGARIFVPAPSADLLVEVAVERIKRIAHPTAIEVGTGCGAVALGLANAVPHAEIQATDLDTTAVRWARLNARRLGLERVRFSSGSLLDPLAAGLHGTVDLVIANLPYVPAGDLAIGSVRSLAINGFGPDGLDLLRRLAHQALYRLRPGGTLQLQMLASQWKRFAPELADLGYRPGPPLTSGAFAICSAERAAAAH